MRAIAREAGVGIATLYRHFPTKESLVDAVYGNQVERLTTGARELLDQLPPGRGDATLDGPVRRLDRDQEWNARHPGGDDRSRRDCPRGDRMELLAAITAILDAGRLVGDLRRDITAEDIAASLIGIFTVAPKPQRTLWAAACWTS